MTRLIPLLIIVVTAVAFFFFKDIRKAGAEWFDPSWYYRKAIAVTNNTNAQDNVYISLNADTSDTDKFQTDCGDIRFTNYNGSLLPYYIVSGCGTGSTVIHVEFSTFPAGSQTIYMYYGNPSAANGFSLADFSAAASNYTIGSTGSEEKGPAPVAYWKFDEGSGTTAHDSSSNRNDGTISGATWTSGKYGSALSFDGTDGDYVEVADSSSLDITDAITIEAWVYDPPPITSQTAANSQTINTKPQTQTNTSVLSTTQAVEFDEPIELTEQRTESSKHYLMGYTEDGRPRYAIDSQIGPIHYKDNPDDESEPWKEIKTDILASEDADYSYQMTQAGYHAYFKEMFNSGKVVRLEKQGEWLEIQPGSLNWTEDGSLPELISKPQEALGKVTGNKIYWQNAYGQNLDFEWLTRNAILEKHLIVNKLSDLPKPESPEEATLELNLGFEFSNGVTMIKTEQGGIEFINEKGETLWGFMPLRYWDSGDPRNEGVSEFNISTGQNNNISLSIRVPYSWLQTATYPVYIDTTLNLSVGAIEDDAWARYNAYINGQTYIYVGMDTIQTYDSIMRFTGVNIPSGATISSCYLTLIAYTSDSGTSVNTLLSFEHNQNPAQIANLADYISRPITDTVAYNNVPSWTGGVSYQLPDISSALQDLVTDHGGTGDAIIAFWKDNGSSVGAHRLSASWDHATYNPPAIHIEYTPPAPPTVTNSTGGSNVSYTSARLNGEVTDAGSENPSAYFYWGDNDGGDTAGNWDHQAVVPDSPSQPQGAATFYKDITGLSPGKHYYYRAYASSSGGGDWADSTESFTALARTITGKGQNAYQLQVDDNLNVSGYINGQAVTAQITKAWHHVALTYDGAIQKIYIDGVLKDSKALTGAIATNSTNLKIGDLVNGEIDDVRIYNYAREPDEIRLDYNAGSAALFGSQETGNPVAHWRFDEGYGTTTHDTSANKNTGTITGASWNNNGKVGKALNFNGTSNYVEISDNPVSLQITNDLSISAWINLSTNNAVHDIVAKKGSSGDFGYRLSTTDTGKLQFELSSGGANTRAATGSATLATNTWYHVVGVYSPNNSMTVYVNGTQDGQVTTALPASIYNSTGNVNIGAENGGTSNFFTGSIDEVKIYPSVLTVSDIQAEYNQGKVVQMGSLSDTSGLTGGSVASNSASAAYCIPGDTATCSPPVAEWNFNEKVSGNAQTIYDTSGNGNNGTTYYGANLTGMNCKIIGKYGSACLFDGVDDYVSFSNSASLQISNPISVEFWFKGNGFTGAYQQILWKRYDSGGVQGWQVYANNTTNVIPFLLWLNGVGKSASITYTPGVWTHFVGTYDGANIRVYKNGVLAGGPTICTVTPLTNTPLLIGSAASNPTNGLIDEVRIFNYARTPAQVAWDYNRGKPFGYWKFDECQGTTAYDSSGNGNNGTITIGATVPQSTAGTCTTPADGTGAWYNGKTGKFNSSFSFDGVDDYVSVSNTISGIQTVSFWIKPTSTTAKILDVNTSGPAYISASSGVISATGFSSPTIYVNGAPSTTLTANVWQYVAATTGTGLTGSAIAFGKANGTYLNGLIDDVKVYNYPLTLSQIKVDYNQGAAVRFGPSSGRP